MIGPIQEFQNVSIDCFEGEKNYSSTCFFLTHCHSDHTKGLKEIVPFLKKNGYYLHCSEITRLILLNSDYGFEEDQIKGFEGSQLIEVPGNEKYPPYQLTVTAIPAGHCPGSVMFLLEDPRKTVLFTGDFRIMKEDVSKLKPLENYLNGSKSIETIYIDATFKNEKYREFRSRQEYVEIAINHIKDQFRKNPDFHVDILTGAKCGYEDFLIQLADEFKCKIHVDHDYFRKFSQITSIGRILTTEENGTRFHYCYGGNRTRYVSIPEPFYQIKLCAQSFKDQSFAPKILTFTHELTNKRCELHRLCYPTHSSLSEIQYFLNYLNHKNVVHICPTFS